MSKLSSAADGLPVSSPLRKKVDGLKAAADGGYLREAMMDLYTSMYDAMDKDDSLPPAAAIKLSDQLRSALKEEYGAEEFSPENITEVRDGWVQPTKGSRIMTGQLRRIVRPGLKDASGKLLLPAVAEVD